ncbi:MAG: oligosaccharide flippase family protein [Proteobacteria bacterium]|nr:oligosaccharide flippase family protein [Pseudomonadota bacterium]
MFAKGMGLVIAVLVARFLGADAMGLFALLFSVAMLLETFISIGMSDSLVRDVAATPAQARNLYLHALEARGGNQRGAGAGARHGRLPERRSGGNASQFARRCRGCADFWRFRCVPGSHAGTERVLMLTWVTFPARVLSLIWLLIAFFAGPGSRQPSYRASCSKRRPWLFFS